LGATDNNYTKKACCPELVMAVLCGAGHVILELATKGTGSSAMTPGLLLRCYTLAAAAGWGCYLLWRSIVTPGALEVWGLRRAGFLRALGSSAVFVLAAGAPLLIYGQLHSRLPLPPTFWLVAALYTVWGIAQQFYLQALVTRNLRQLIPGIPFRVLAAAALFGAVHFPDYRIMALAFIAGLGLTWIYERYRNIWAVGIAHGILGALFLYLVLGLDHGWEQLATFIK